MPVLFFFILAFHQRLHFYCKFGCSPIVLRLLCSSVLDYSLYMFQFCIINILHIVFNSNLPLELISFSMMYETFNCLLWCMKYSIAFTKYIWRTWLMMYICLGFQLQPSWRLYNKPSFTFVTHYNPTVQMFWDLCAWVRYN